ncbi:MAG: hypothetical protein JWQ55_3047, partial [Rhodopila sp.]|nr:hypothetical protein [Rhodopila sp.]
VVEIVVGDALLDLPEIQASLSLTELYEGIQFPPDPPITA